MSDHQRSLPQQQPSYSVPKDAVVKRIKAKGPPKMNVTISSFEIRVKYSQLLFCNISVLNAEFLSYFSVIYSTVPHLACTRYKRCFSLDSGSATAQRHPHNLRFCVREPRDSQGVWRARQRAHHQRHKDYDTKGPILHLHVDNHLVAQNP